MGYPDCKLSIFVVVVDLVMSVMDKRFETFCGIF